MRSMLKIFLIVFTFLNFESRGQAIISQDFEASISPWITTGTVVASQNSIIPHGGSGMLALSVAKELSSSNFTLPTGLKNVNFWMNSYTSAPFSYQIALDLYLNNVFVINLGSWFNITPWTQYAVQIPSGYIGNNYSIKFSITSNGPPDLCFYLDDIYISPDGVGIKELNINNDQLFVTNDNSDPKNIFVLSMLQIENCTMEFYDLTGKKVFSEENLRLTSGKSLKIHLNNIDSGLYLFNFSSENIQVKKKIIIY